MKNRNLMILSAMAFVAAIIATRFIDHPANFTAVGAAALLSGFYLKHKWSFLLPLGTLFATDLLIGFYDWRVMLAVYGGFLMMWGLGKFASREGRWITIPMAALGSTLFFVMSNFAVWAFTEMYVKTSEGLVQAYLMAIPFYKWSLLGDLFYTASLLAIIEAIASVAALRGQERLSTSLTVNP